MATVHPAQDRELLTDVEHAHSHASTALDDRRASSLAAVTWSSAHLAAVERVLHPVGARAVDGGGVRVRDQRAVDQDLEHRTPVPRPMTRRGTYALDAHHDRSTGTTGR